MTAQLRQLRESANPSLSLRKMAAKLEFTPEGYRFYETPKGFKGRFLPMELTRKIANILKDHGVNPDEVLALAGIGDTESPSNDLSAGEARLVASFRDLTPKERRLLQSMADQLRGKREPPGEDDPSGRPTRDNPDALSGGRSRSHASLDEACY